MRKISILFFLTMLLTAANASAESNISVFPPQNWETDCINGNNALTWDGAHSVRCKSAGDLFIELFGSLNCSSGQTIAIVDGKPTCKSVGATDYVFLRSSLIADSNELSAGSHCVPGTGGGSNYLLIGGQYKRCSGGDDSYKCSTQCATVCGRDTWTSHYYNSSGSAVSATYTNGQCAKTGDSDRLGSFNCCDGAKGETRKETHCTANAADIAWKACYDHCRSDEYLYIDCSNNENYLTGGSYSFLHPGDTMHFCENKSFGFNNLPEPYNSCKCPDGKKITPLWKGRTIRYTNANDPAYEIDTCQ